MPVPRVAPALTVLLIGALVLFGCGKGSSSSPGQRTSTTTTTSPGHGSGGSGNDNRGGKSSPAPGTAADAAKAKAFARAVNLTAVDLPGFKASAKSQHLTPAERKLEREALGCLGGAGAKHEKGSINVRSQEFEATLGEVTRQAESEVTVVRTPAIAAHQLSIVRGSHARDCLAHFLTLLFGGATAGKAAVSPVHIAEGTPPAPGADGSFAWRVTTTITTRHVPVKIYLDIFGFTRGRAEVQMLTASFLQPFPARVEERLFSLLLERATSHEP